MNDLLTVIAYSRLFESLLDSELSASGKGLHQKVSSVSSALGHDLVSGLRKVATLRNKMLHEDEAQNYLNIDEFVALCESLKDGLKEKFGLSDKAIEKKFNSALNVFGDSFSCPYCVHKYRASGAIDLMSCSSCNKEYRLRTKTSFDIEFFHYWKSSKVDGQKLAYEILQMSKGHARKIPLNVNALATLGLYCLICGYLLNQGNVGIYRGKTAEVAAFVSGNKSWKDFVQEYWALQQGNDMSNEMANDLVDFIEHRIVDVYDHYPRVPEDMGIRLKSVAMSTFDKSDDNWVP